MQYNQRSRFTGIVKSGVMRRGVQGITASAITFLSGFGMMNAQTQVNSLPLSIKDPIGIGAAAPGLTSGPLRPLHIYGADGIHGNNPVIRIGTGNGDPTSPADRDHTETSAAHIGIISSFINGTTNNNNEGNIPYLPYSVLGFERDFFISGGTIDNFNSFGNRKLLPIRNMIFTNRSSGESGGGNLLFATTPGPFGSPDVERMRITPWGNVGIANSDPKEALHIGNMMTFGVGANENHISYNELSTANGTRERLVVSNILGTATTASLVPSMSITFDRMRGGFMMLGNAGRGGTIANYEEPNGGYKGIIIGNETNNNTGIDRGTIGMGTFPLLSTRVAIRGMHTLAEIPNNAPPQAVANALYVGRGEDMAPILTAKDNLRVGIGTDGPRDILQLGSKFTFHAGGSSVIAHNAFYDASSGKMKLIEAATVPNPNPNPNLPPLPPYKQRPAIIGMVDGNISLQVSNDENAAAGSDANFDSKGLFINNNGNVGVGEMYPSVRMVVRGAQGTPATQNIFEVRKHTDNAILMSVNNAGTTVVKGSAGLGNSDNVFEVRNSDNGVLFGVNSNGIQSNGNQGMGTTATATSRLTVRGTSTLGDNTFIAEQNDGTPSIRVRNDGRVGIGNGTFPPPPGNVTTMDPMNDVKLHVWGSVQVGGQFNNFSFSGMNHRLSVDGAVVAREVRVTANDWADFVFKKSYNLPTLESVEQFITDNGHLPGIPSEQEVKENGVSLNDMQVKLLQKVEELTLYVIELKKQNERLEKQIQSTTTNTQR